MLSYDLTFLDVVADLDYLATCQLSESIVIETGGTPVNSTMSER
jgi:hypothetical protein